MAKQIFGFKASALFYSFLGFTLLVSNPPFQAKAKESVQFLNSGASTTTPFSPAVRAGQVLYLSGQLGLVPGTNKLLPGGIQPETRQAMKNIATLLENSGYSMQNVIKCTVFLADMNEFASFNKEYLSFFSKPYPARSAIGINSLAFGGRVEIECVAAK
jgi:reactive intermediate/imine deaminase